MSRELWLDGGLLVTQDAPRSIRKGALRIVDGKIAEIRRRAPSKPRKGMKLRDVSGKLLLPGFVQAHVHLCQTLFRNQADDLELLDWLKERIWPMEAAHTKASLRASAEIGILELLSGGTTCILDMGTVHHTEEIFKAVLESGIRANVGKCLMDHPTETPPGLREETTKALNEAVSLHAKWNGREKDRIRASYAPRFVLSCTEQLLRAVSDLCREQGAILHTHASENTHELEKVRQTTGKGNVEYFQSIGLLSEKLVLAHGIWLEKQEISWLASAGAHVTHCPSSNLKLASGIARVPELLKAGVNVALGADGAPCNNRLDAFQEMRLAALLPKAGGDPTALPAQEALDLATRNGAKALGWDQAIGSLEVGKDADFLVLDPLPDAGSGLFSRDLQGPGRTDSLLSSLVYAGHSGWVRETWVQGNLLFANGKALTLDAESVRIRAERERSRILRKIDE